MARTGSSVGARRTRSLRSVARTIMKDPDLLQTASQSSWLRRVCAIVIHWLELAGALVAVRLRYVWSRPVVCLLIPALVLILLPVMGLVHHVYFNRSDLPDLERFVRFELP